MQKSKNDSAHIHSPDPFLWAEKFSLGFAKSKSPENSFRKIESELKPRRLPEALRAETRRKMFSSF